MDKISSALNFDINTLRTPYYAVDENALIKNLEILQDVKRRSGCKILLAQKCFSMYYTYPLIAKYLDGATSSGLHEAKLCKEYFAGESHVFSPCYLEVEFEEILNNSDHIVFNSLTQWHRYKERAKDCGKQCGLRINPECSTQEHAIYDPCVVGSRFGVKAEDISYSDIEGLDGLHFHTLCEQGAEPLVKTLEAVESKFGKYLSGMKWVNFGGGHHITRDDYNVELLVETIKKFSAKHGVQVYLEPGEAVALNAGYLVATVLEIVHNGMDIAILDASAACHMPDVIEMPYKPPILFAKDENIQKHTYRLSSNTCLAGDVIGDYSFGNKLFAGDKIALLDMAIYSMVKNNTFNGMRLPTIAYIDSERKLIPIKTFGYSDFVARL